MTEYERIIYATENFHLIVKLHLLTCKMDREAWNRINTEFIFHVPVSFLKILSAFLNSEKETTLQDSGLVGPVLTTAFQS